MTICAGTPAELHALQYVEGTLAEFEAGRFEEHYFDCPICLAHLRAIQALGQELVRHPIAPLREPEPRIPLGWPVWSWAAGAATALLLIGVFAYKSLEFKPAKPTISQSQPKSLPQTEMAARPVQPSLAPVHFSQLADLTLPAFIAPNLRGESLDAHFEAGMDEYAKGNCRGAIAALSQVPAQSADARAAEFYSGACQMHLGDFASASRVLRKVVDAGDSLQQEAALYALAQIALTGDKPAMAHKCLLRAISLHGDLERRAREQDRRIAALVTQNIAATGRTR
jgi:tetratricopeptide (TPR) repeat protein